MENEINIDMSKRTPEEWAKIYNLKIYNVPRKLWSEFEWAYNLSNLDYQYILKDDSSELSEQMELRAFEIKNMIFQFADSAEKSILKNKFIETEWIKKKLLLNNI